jgi:predicted nucleic acid-binding protein
VNFLVDTNVISEQTRPDPDEAVLNWLEENNLSLFLSAITVAELKKGIERQPESRRKQNVSRWFDEVLESFNGRIYAFDLEVSMTWGRMYAETQRKGYNPPALDSLNAAIALHHNLTLATRNERDFAETGVKIVNPWKK